MPQSATNFFRRSFIVYSAGLKKPRVSTKSAGFIFYHYYLSGDDLLAQIAGEAVMEIAAAQVQSFNLHLTTVTLIAINDAV